MSFSKGIRLKMNREAIIANLRGIWEALCQGDQIESFLNHIANFD